MRQERFTEMAQEAIALSQQLVQQYNHNQWDVEHILLALLMQEKGIVVEILQDLKVDVEAVKSQVSAALERMPKVSYARDRFMPRRVLLRCILPLTLRQKDYRMNLSAPNIFSLLSPGRAAAKLIIFCTVLAWIKKKSMPPSRSSAADTA